MCLLIFFNQNGLECFSVYSCSRFLFFVQNSFGLSLDPFFLDLFVIVCEWCLYICYFFSCSFQCFDTSKMNTRAIVLRATFNDIHSTHMQGISYKPHILPACVRAWCLCVCCVSSDLVRMFSLFCMYGLGVFVFVYARCLFGASATQCTSN